MLAQIAEKLVRQRHARRNLVDKGIGTSMLVSPVSYTNNSPAGGEAAKRRWDCYNGALLSGDVRKGFMDKPIIHPVKKASITSVIART